MAKAHGHIVIQEQLCAPFDDAQGMLWTSVPPCLRGHLKKQSQFAALHGRARRRFQRVRFCKSVRFYADVFTSFYIFFTSFCSFVENQAYFNEKSNKTNADAGLRLETLNPGCLRVNRLCKTNPISPTRGRMIVPSQRLPRPFGPRNDIGISVPLWPRVPFDVAQGVLSGYEPVRKNKANSGKLK